MFKKIFMSIILFLSFNLCIFGAIINISSCGTYTNSFPGTSYELNTNIVTAGNCIFLNNNPISLDCKGFNISGDGTGTSISVQNLADGTIVKNCVITNFNSGIYINSASNSIIENVSVFNSFSGFYMYDQYNLTINNSLAQNTTNGIYLQASSNNNNIINSNFSDNIFSINIDKTASEPLNNIFVNNYLGTVFKITGDHNFSTNTFSLNLFEEEGSGPICFPFLSNYTCDNNPIYLLNTISEPNPTYITSLPSYGISSVIITIILILGFLI
jgi:parallel beta-helix repeat protein